MPWLAPPPAPSPTTVVLVAGASRAGSQGAGLPPPACLLTVCRVCPVASQPGRGLPQGHQHVSCLPRKAPRVADVGMSHRQAFLKERLTGHGLQRTLSTVTESGAEPLD